MMLEFEESLPERVAHFISVDFRQVIRAFVAQAKDWLERHGNVLKSMGDKEL